MNLGIPSPDLRRSAHLISSPEPSRFHLSFFHFWQLLRSEHLLPRVDESIIQAHAVIRYPATRLAGVGFRGHLAGLLAGSPSRE